MPDRGRPLLQRLAAAAAGSGSPRATPVPSTTHAARTTDARTTPKPKRTISEARVRAREVGIRAERAAADHVRGLGFDVLATNLRVGRYEIDVLARERSVLVVIEVRTRGAGALVRALDSIDARKRARLRTAGKWLWRDRFARDARFDRLRFDCVSVTFDAAGAASIEHVRAAF